MVASAPAVPFWQSMPASILKDYRKQIPTQPRSRSAIRLALVTALILGLIALTAMKYCQDKVLGSPRFTYSVLYDPAYTPPAEQQRKQGKPSEEAESRTCPCRVRTLPWGSFAAWNTSALQAYLAPAQTAAFATNNTASAYDTAFMNAQCTSLVMGARTGPYNITPPAVTAQDVELFVPLAVHNLGLNSTVPAQSLSGALARKDVQAHLIASHAVTHNITAILDSLPPGVLAQPIADYYRIIDNDVLWARYRFCQTTLESANEIITPPDSATGIAVYRWKYESADLEDDQTVIDAFHREIGISIWQACRAAMETYWSHYNLARFRFSAQTLDWQAALSNATAQLAAGSPVPAADFAVINTYGEKRKLEQLDVTISYECSVACVDFQNTMRLFVLANIQVNHSTYAELCQPGPFCDVTKSKSALHWITEALTTIGGQWTTLWIITNLLWEAISTVLQKCGVFEALTEDYDARGGGVGGLHGLPSAPESLGAPLLKADRLDSACGKLDETQQPGPAAFHVEQPGAPGTKPAGAGKAAAAAQDGSAAAAAPPEAAAQAAPPTPRPPLPPAAVASPDHT